MNQSKEIFKIPDPVSERVGELNDLIEKYPIDIPVKECAGFLHMGYDSLRAFLEQSPNSFGMCWKNGANRAFSIPATKFYLWYMNNLC